MKRSKVFFIAVIGAMVLAACSSGGSDATVQFDITDAPVASDAVKEVYVTFSSLEINDSTSAGDGGSGWTSVPIDATREYELLSLTNGLSAALGSIEMTGGTRINQIRFGISNLELVTDADAATGVRTPITLASSTGLKIVNAFDIPLSGNVTVVADFDVRKSLVDTGTGYKMKPVLRAVVEGEAGEIHGTAPAGYLVFAYESVLGSDIDLTFTDPANDADSAVYDDAYTSAAVVADGTYTLAFMDSGSYDLVLVKATDSTVGQVVNDVIVESAKGTVQNIALP
jgi:hypothetical protein